jgi:hypothetical protein
MARSFLVLLVVACLAVPLCVSAEDGSAGLAFLKLGVDARAIAMGDAHVALGGGASSVYWNPAGAVAVDNIDVVLMHSEWFQDIRYEFAGGVRSDGRQAFGLGLMGLYTDEIEERGEDPHEDPIGTFSVFSFAVSGTYALRLTDGFDVGGSVKYLNETVDQTAGESSATGFAVDLGAIYRPPAPPGLSTGVAIQNLGPQMKFKVDEFDLPTQARAGAALEIPVSALNGGLVLVGDAILPLTDGDVKVHGGLEFEYAEILALRFGYRTGWDNQNVSWGVGVKARNFRVDYAFVPFYSDLGDTHRISLGFTL